MILNLVQSLFRKSENLEQMSDMGFLEDDSNFANNLVESWQGFVSKLK